MHHEVFGELTHDEAAGAWETVDLIPAFASFGQQLIHGHGPSPDADPEELDEQFDRRAELFAEGRFPITLHDLDGEGPSDAQAEAYRYFIENEATVGDAVITALLRDYQERWEERRGQMEPYWPEDELDAALPKLASSGGLRNLIRLERVEIHEAEEDGCAYVGLAFECSWDEDHGIGVRLCRDQVVEIGESGVAHSEVAAAA